MKGVVGEFPLRFKQTLRPLDDGQTIQAMMRGDHPALPLHIALTDRQGQRPALDMQSRVRDVTDFLRGDAANAEAFLIFGIDESRRRQSR
ncbi:hypothetical protein D3C87_1575450 [compost metagenome]